MGENGQRGPVFDPHSPELSPERAYRLCAELRVSCPVPPAEKYGGYWAVSRYADVTAVATEWPSSTSAGPVHVTTSAPA